MQLVRTVLLTAQYSGATGSHWSEKSEKLSEQRSGSGAGVLLCPRVPCAKRHRSFPRLLFVPGGTCPRGHATGHTAIHGLNLDPGFTMRQQSGHTSRDSGTELLSGPSSSTICV